MHRVRAYIDGFNLYYGMHAVFGRQYLWLDVEALAHSLLKPGQLLDRVTYFTARMRQPGDTFIRQTRYLEALSAHCACLDIVEGRFQEQRKRCWSCGAKRITYEEKETDVGIAVALVEDAARGAYDTALVISGDSDLCPGVRAAKRLAPHSRIVVVFPPQRVSDPLRMAADGVYWLGRDKLAKAQLPHKVTTAGGVVLERPAYWARV
jgi:uncharacterized LabA/DUF88 family protein